MSLHPAIILQHGMSPLEIAAWKGSTDVVKILLACPQLIVTSSNKLGTNALLKAALCDRTDACRVLVEDARIDINATEMEGYLQGSTALHLAASNGKVEMVRILLGAAGINVNAVDKCGRTPLHVAANRGGPSHVNTVRVLLEDSRVDVNAADKVCVRCVCVFVVCEVTSGYLLYSTVPTMRRMV